MKTSKIIVEYIEKRVKEHFPKTAEELAWEVEENKMSKAFKEAKKLIDKSAEQIIEEINEKYGFKDYRLKKENYSLVTNTSRGNDELYQASAEAYRKRYETINDTVANILISLELSGTKDDLEEMLANIGK